MKKAKGKGVEAGQAVRRNTTMPDARAVSPVGPCVVERVLLVSLNHRVADHAFVSHSLPGHLLQLMLTGGTLHEANGRRYELRPGSLIWYHQDELVKGRVEQPPWSFYSLNFVASALPPPAFEDRVRQVDGRVRKLFDDLYACWCDMAQPPAVREMRVQAAVLQLLASLAQGRSQMYQMDPSSHLWWQIESWLREDLSRPVSLTALSGRFGKSAATIARSAQAAVGLPPMKRLKQIRMSLAAGLVARSELLFKQIAAQVGYERVHEFSRDYRAAHGVSPRAHRAMLNPSSQGE